MTSGWMASFRLVIDMIELPKALNRLAVGNGRALRAISQSFPHSFSCLLVSEILSGWMNVDDVTEVDQMSNRELDIKD